MTVEDFDTVKEQYLRDIKNVIKMNEIPDDLVLNWDQTGIYYVPVSSWTMDKEGSKIIQIVGSDDKRQLTAIFAVYLTGVFYLHIWYIKAKPHFLYPSVCNFLQTGM